MPDPEEGTEQATPEAETPESAETSDQSDEQAEAEGDGSESTPEPEQEGTAGKSVEGGKTTEQLAAELAEKDRVIASLYGHRAEQEHEAALLKAIAETGPAPSYGAPAPPTPGGPYAPTGVPQIPPFDPKRVVTEEEYLADPVIATAKIAEAKAMYDRAVYNVIEGARRRESAQGNFLKGRQDAQKATPKLFAGIAKEVDAEVVASYRRGQISPEQLSDPRTHQLVAELIRRDRGELDFGKYYKAGPTPMPALQTEKPKPGPAAKPKVTLTAEQRQLVELWGTPLDRFTKAYEQERG